MRAGNDLGARDLVLQRTKERTLHHERAHHQRKHLEIEIAVAREGEGADAEEGHDGAGRGGGLIWDMRGAGEYLANHIFLHAERR